MNLRNTLTALTAIALFAAAGCQGPATGGDLDNLDDINENGFVDVAPPDGVEFDDATNAKVRLTNDIGATDLATLAAEQGYDPSLLNFVDVSADLVITLIYDGFENLVIRQTQVLEPFERTLEAACPDAINVQISVKVTAPVVGPQTVFSDTFELTQGIEYECGETLEVLTFVDDTGNPQVDVTAQ